MSASGSSDSNQSHSKWGPFQFKYALIGIVVLFILGNTFYTLRKVGNNQGYAPKQPIPFSHKLHAGDNGIPCLYCHSAADKSKSASVPPVNVCMNCHSVVKTDSPFIKQVKEHYDKNIPIEWIKVHDLPDHANFNHKRHVAKGVACETCHGNVKKMDVIEQDQPLTMGWCLDCHRGKTAPEHLMRAPENTPRNSGIEAGSVAPTSCYTCHH